MSETLRNFLVDLASDPVHMQRFMDHPADTVNQWSQGQTDEEGAAVLSRDPRRILRALGAAGGGPVIAKKGGKKKGAKKPPTKKKRPSRP